MKKKNKKTANIALVYYLPVLFWLGLIFYFSSLPGLGIQYQPDVWFYVTRKGAHVGEYFILCWLLIRLFYFYKIKNWELSVASGLLSLAYAFSDEIHQLFVPGREGKFFDIGMDLAGILLAAAIWKLTHKKFKKKYILKYIF